VSIDIPPTTVDMKNVPTATSTTPIRLHGVMLTRREKFSFHFTYIPKNYTDYNKHINNLH